MIRTIIVDDEILSRIGLQSFLDGKEGIKVSGVFGEANEALKFLEENMIDVVLTDIEMAEKDGLEFIREIREKNLAPGVIIVSCHDDFSYAQKAISLGTDSYVLKHSVTEEALIREVKKVYEKTENTRNKQKIVMTSSKEEPGGLQQGIYRVGVFVMDAKEDPDIMQDMTPNRDMLVHLLEQIVNRYQMGTLFAPYGREIFLVFQLKPEIEMHEREEIVSNWLHLLQKNIRQYLTGEIIIGVGSEYTNLSETRNQYTNAAVAAEQHFFKHDQYIFYYRKTTSHTLKYFSVDRFMEDTWMNEFEQELELWLDQAWKQQMQIAITKKMLIQNVQQMFYYISLEYHLGEDFYRVWSEESEFLTRIAMARNSTEIKEILLKKIKDFRQAALLKGMQNPLSEVLSYIDQHLEGKLTLSEMADRAGMSVPSFCKKFKEYTKKTVTQYINEQRVQRAAELLKQQKYSLEEIAELTGFSNANYLIRVFKKSTGQTIGQYRRKYAIRE